jgi:hypothetical protein
MACLVNNFVGKAPLTVIAFFAAVARHCLLPVHAALLLRPRYASGTFDGTQAVSLLNPCRGA